MIDARRLGLLAALSAATALPAAGQIGHLPESSPYRDLRIKQTLSAVGGYFMGGRGTPRVGPSGGSVVGLRWDVWFGGGPATGYLAVWRGDLTRNLVRPTDPPATRFFDTASQQIYIADAGLNFVLTGRKTWRGFAPYLGASLGMAFGSSVPQDSTGFAFKNKFHIGPTVGVKWHPNRTFHIRVEARDLLWRLTYPRGFQEGAEPLLDPVTARLSEWVHHGMFTIALGYTIRL